MCRLLRNNRKQKQSLQDTASKLLLDLEAIRGLVQRNEELP